MRILVIILFLILFFLLHSKKEDFENLDTIKPNNFLDDELNINLNRIFIIKMNDMVNFINNPDDYEPEIYRNLPNNYKNRHTYIQILYEMFVIDLLDNYIVNRFDAHKLLNITYKYPSYNDINDKYPQDKIKKDYDRIFKDFLDPSIKYLYKNKDTNLDQEYFKFTVKNIQINDLKKIKSELDNLDPNNLKEYYDKYIKIYFIEVLKNLNIIHQNNCNDTELFPFIFTFKEITQESSSKTLELIDDILENEIRYY
jgi:hypothetical protein